MLANAREIEILGRAIPMDMHGPGCDGLDQKSGRKATVLDESKLSGGRALLQQTADQQPRLFTTDRLPQIPDFRMIHAAVEQFDAVTIRIQQIEELGDHRSKLGDRVVDLFGLERSRENRRGNLRSERFFQQHAQLASTTRSGCCQPSRPEVSTRPTSTCETPEQPVETNASVSQERAGRNFIVMIVSC